MAKNKHALIRYRAIDKCLANSKIRYTGAQIREQVNRALEAYDPQTKGISKSQFYADLEFMKSSDGYNIEIEEVRDGRHVYLRYADEKFSIQNMPLTELECNQLKDALGILTHFQGLPQFQWMEETIAKLNQEIQPVLQKPIIIFDSNQYLKGIEWLAVLYNAAQYKKALRISYQPFSAEAPYEIEFHPYFLKQYNNRWFAFGHCAENETPIRTVALDRIIEIREANCSFVENTSIDADTYFEDIIGVTRPQNGTVEKIELRFSPERAGYVLTKPMHGSQKKVALNKNGLVITLEVIPNPELLQMIYSFGKDVEVMAPVSLREIVSESAKELNDFYL